MSISKAIEKIKENKKNYKKERKKKHKKNRNIDLSDSNLTIENIKLLVQSLKEDPYVENVYLRGNKITDETVKLLTGLNRRKFSFGKRRKGLTYLDLSNNKLTDKSASFLIMDLFFVETIDISFNNFSNKVISELRANRENMTFHFISSKEEIIVDEREETQQTEEDIKDSKETAIFHRKKLL